MNTCYIIQENDLNHLVKKIAENVVALLGKDIQQQGKLYNNQQACEYLGVCNKTLQNYRDDGLITFRQIGRKIYYTQEDLNNFLQKNIQQPFK